MEWPYYSRSMAARSGGRGELNLVLFGTRERLTGMAQVVFWKVPRP